MSSSEPDPEVLWRTTRGGAATVAGIDFQVVVSAALLVHARVGPIRAAGVRPEGFEDVDCLPPPGGRGAFVQAKDRAAGDATWTRSDMAAAIGHAAPAMRLDPDARFVLVTNARPGQGLRDTGWDGSLGDALDAGDLEALLEAVQRTDSVVDVALLSRCALHRATRIALADTAVQRLGQDHGLPLAVADIVFRVLLDELQQDAAAQRLTKLGKARHRTPADLDALVHDIRSTVDVNALEGPVRRGLVAPVDFTMPIDLPVERFLLGIDVRPGHIAAELDVRRPDQAAAMFDALRDGRGAILSGPSGAGKSTLLWRCAHELAGSVRLVELRRASADDIEDVVRWLRTQRPTTRAKILICADDVGGPGLAGWPEFAARVADLPGVLLLGACREEDLTPELLAGDLALLRLVLDETLADHIALQLAARGVLLRRQPNEAFREAEGLLLEYVALLATGERLDQVVGSQVHQRLGSGRTAEREALRYVSAAHLGGLGIPFDALGALVDRPEELPEALSRLADEFLVRSQDDAWIGLHETRSAAAHDALHELPPPTQETTICRLLPVLNPPDAAHLLRRVVDRGMRSQALLPGLREALTQADTAGTAVLLEAAIDVDALEHARSCWQITLAIWGPAAADAALKLAFIGRFGGAPDSMPNARVRSLAAALPEPPRSLAAEAARSLDHAELVRRALNATSAEAASLLEAVAVAEPLKLTTDDAQAILDAHASGDSGDVARLVYALWSLTPAAADDPGAVLGPRDLRLGRLADVDERVVGWTVPDPGEKVHVAVFMLDGDLPTKVRQDVGRAALDLCPEASGVQMEPRTPQGAMQSVPAHETMDVAAAQLPSPRIDTRRNQAFLAALDRIRAAESWSQRLSLQRQLCERLHEIMRDARVRLALAHDNDRRRREWQVAVADAAAEAGRLPTLPLPRRSDEKVGAEDHARGALDRIIAALSAMARAMDGEDVALGAVGIGLNDVARELRAPAAGPGSALVRMVDDLLGTEVDRLSRLLRVQHDRPSFRVGDRRAGEPWVDVIDRETAEVEKYLAAEEAAIIDSALDGLAVEMHTVDLAGAASRSNTAESSEQVPGPRYLVVTSEEDWETAIWDHLATLGEEQRMKIAFRVFVVPRRSGLVLPTEAWQIGSAKVYPADPGRVSQLARAAGLAVLASPDLDRYLSLLDSIIDASAAAALASSRRAAGLDATHAVARADAALDRCRELAAGITPDVAARSVAHLITVTEQELQGQVVMSQIVGHILLERYGDENFHSHLMSTTRGMLVGLAADAAAADADA